MNAMSPVFCHSFVVDPSAVDQLGHANNAVYLNWMQDAAIAHSTHCGWPVTRYLELGKGWIARSHHIDYLRPLEAGDCVTIQTWISDVKRVSSRRMYEFRKTESDEVVAKAETHWAFVSLNQLRPARVPDEFYDDFQVR